MKKEYVIGIDHGTGGCQVTCINSQGEIIAESYTPYPSHHPKPKWVEQSPVDWINAAIKGIKDITKNFKDDEKTKIKAISFSGPAHVAVLLDKNNNVLRNPIMWNDQRSGDEAEYLANNHYDLIFNETNHKPTPTWTICHLLWLQKHEKSIFDNIDKILFEKDYIRYRFSGEFGTDLVEAEGSMLFNYHTKNWSDVLCSLASVPQSWLPSVYGPTDQLGTLTNEMASTLNIPSGIPIIVGSVDTAAEILASGVNKKGDSVVKIATAGNFTILDNNLQTNTNLTGYNFLLDDIYYLNSATNSAASSFRWFKESFYQDYEEKYGSEDVYLKIDEEIEKVNPGSDGLLFHPYLTGERSPYWDANLKASFFGVTARHNREHFARSVLEGVAFSIKDASLEFPSLPTDTIKIIGGGSKSKIWTQIMADIFNLEFEAPKFSDSSFGTSLIAATAVGWYTNLQSAVEQTQTITRKICPIPENVQIYEDLFQIYKDFQKNTQEISHRLSKINE